MAQLVLSEADLKQLSDYLGTVPYNYAAPLVQFLNQKAQEQAPKVEGEEAPKTKLKTVK